MNTTVCEERDEDDTLLSPEDPVASELERDSDGLDYMIALMRLADDGNPHVGGGS